jgi:superoxide reductase
MTIQNQVYKCEICGNIVEVLHPGKGELVCCGQPMNLQEENFQGEYAEKHSPIIKEINGRFLVEVGKVEHPMEEKHYIEWIEAVSKTGKSCKKFLTPTDKPRTKFSFKPIKVRMYCNVHGLWISE